MTRFVVLADTHLGASSTGFQQQRKYPERLPALLAALKSWILADGGIDFVLHGGDMIEKTREGLISTAVDLFDFPVPVYLCLGNHDLTLPTARSLWMDLAPGFFPDRRPEFPIITQDGIIQVVPNHWGDSDYHWNASNEARLSPDQVAFLRENLHARPRLPHLIVTHSPVIGIPVEQTGFAEPFHSPVASFTDIFTGLASKHPNLQCVLGAHNHVNMHVKHRGVDYVTVSSFIEAPFEFKVFEIFPDSVSMSTVSLAESLDFEAEYDESRSFVQGRPVDRFFIARHRAPFHH